MRLFDVLGPVMTGPSSSHTAGAVRIGLTARNLLGEAPKTAEILLHGSFAATGRGHGTDRALVAGLLGMLPDDERIPDSFSLAQQAGLDQSHPALQRWYAAIHETQSDREVVSLYAQLVQPVLDAQARREISRSAAESTLMIAVSPLALVDMAFIAWRNLRLINRIATLYGIELGYYSRLRLFRLVLLNIAFAGASELVREVGMDWMSQDLAARLSARAAQGIGAGLLTARLGIKAMELCRPLPWIADDKPRLGDFRRELIGQLKETLQKSKSGPQP